MNSGILDKTLGSIRFYLAFYLSRGYWGPKICQIEPTNKCNLRCIMCGRINYLLNQPELFDKNMDLSTFKALIEEITDLGTTDINFVGSEPFLNNDLLPMIEESKKKGMQVHLVTNGTLIENRIAEQLVNLGVNSIAISIDGPREDIYERIRKSREAFRKSIEAVGFLQNAKKAYNRSIPEISIAFVVQKQNYYVLDEMISLASRLKVNFITFLLLTVDPWTEYRKKDLLLDDNEVFALEDEIKRSIAKASCLGLTSNLAEYLQMIQSNRREFALGEPTAKIYDKIYCYMPWFFALITPTGDVYPCCDAYPYKQYIMGNINESTFKEIWRSQKYNNFRKKAKHGGFEICKRCSGHYKLNVTLNQAMRPRNILKRLWKVLIHRSTGRAL